MKKKKLENVMPRQCLMMMLNMITCIYLYTNIIRRYTENISGIQNNNVQEFCQT